MKKIFISYKVHNRKQAISYYTRLKDQGYMVWFDQLILKNRSWQDEIKEHIQRADIFLCLLSKECLYDDWVYQQILFAKSYHKKFVYIILDDTPVKDFKKFKIRKRDIYQDIPIFSKEVEELNNLRREINYRMNHPFLSVGIFLFFAIYLFCYGLKIGNLYLNHCYGWACLGISCLLVLSYIPNRIGFYLQSLFSFLLLGFCYFYIPIYYVSDVGINPIVYLLLYSFAVIFRYSKNRLGINFLFSLLYTGLIILLNFVVVMYIQQIYSINVSILSILLLFFVVIFTYYESKEYYDATEDIKQLKNRIYKHS